MQISVILDQAAEILQDVGMVTWTKQQLIRAMNSAIKMVCVHRPDAATTVGEVTLSAGSLQSVPTGCQSVIDTLHNGTLAAPGQAIRMVSKKTKDETEPGWHAASQSSTIYEVVVDERVPGKFWTSPPAVASTKIVMCWAVVPADISTSDDGTAELPILEKYAPAVLEWMLYLAFSRDSVRTANVQRGMDHRASFYSILGIKMQADSRSAPKAAHQQQIQG